MPASGNVSHVEHDRLQHHSHVGRYLVVWGALLVLTIATYLIAKIHIPGGLAIVVALVIATAKGALVALFFMHLWDQRGRTGSCSSPRSSSSRCSSASPWPTTRHASRSRTRRAARVLCPRPITTRRRRRGRIEVTWPLSRRSSVGRSPRSTHRARARTRARGSIHAPGAVMLRPEPHPARARTRRGRSPRSSRRSRAPGARPRPARPPPPRPRCASPARAETRKRPWRWPGRRSSGARALPRGASPPGSSARAASSSPAAPPVQTGPTAWMTYRAGRPWPPVSFASPGRAPPSARHSSSRPGPAARWIAPSTPPPPRSEALAAFTIASTSSRVMSPCTTVIRPLAQVRSMPCFVATPAPGSRSSSQKLDRPAACAPAWRTPGA